MRTLYAILAVTLAACGGSMPTPQPLPPPVYMNCQPGVAACHGGTACYIPDAGPGDFDCWNTGEETDGG